MSKIKLPSLLGMLVTGIVLGPYVLNLLDESLLGISAFLMCFLPASFELLGMIILAPKLMGVTVLEAAIMGAVLAAVSPAVVVPRMVKLMDEGYGVKEGIPQLLAK